MPILFFGTEKFLHEQDILLMQALARQSEQIVFVCPQKSDLANLANSLNIPCLEISNFKLIRLISLIKKIKADNINFVHALDAKAIKTICMVKFLGRLNFKIIATHHDEVNLDSQEREIINNFYAIKALFSQKLFRLFSPSQALLAYLRQNERIMSRVRYLPFAVSDRETNKEQYLMKSNQDERIIFFMNIEFGQHSGLEILFKAVELVKQRDENTTFEIRICAKNLELEPLLAKLEELDLLNCFAFFNNLDPNIFYSSSHIMLCLSMGNEGDFRSIIRAWKHSLPIISSDLAVNIKVLMAGQFQQSALIYPKEQAEALAEHILEIMQNKELQQSLISCGQSMLQAYCLDSLEKTYLEHLDY